MESRAKTAIGEINEEKIGSSPLVCSYLGTFLAHSPDGDSEPGMLVVSHFTFLGFEKEFWWNGVCVICT